ASQSFGNLVPTTYAFTESVPSGWVQTGASCDNGNPPSAVSLAPGLNVTCTFTNTKLAELVVVKRAIGGDGAFAFTSTMPSALNFSVTTTNSVGSTRLVNVAPGTYVLDETTPAGWRLNSATCNDGSSPSAVQLDPGETVICTFDNEKLGSLVVGKGAVGGDATFTFTSTIPGSTTFPVTTISETAIITITGIASGTYSLGELAQPGWDPLLSLCDVGDADALPIGAGETVACLFLNVKEGNLTLRKTAAGQDALFTFSSQTLTPTTFSTTTVNGEGLVRFTNLSVLPTYDLTETVLSGWDLRSAICTGSSTPDAIRIPPGGEVTCTFQSVERSSLTVVKRSVGGDGAFTFNSTLPGGASFTLNTTAGAATRPFADIVSTEYAITETVPIGWIQTSVTCDNGNLPGAVRPAPGASVTCTFTNTRLLDLVVVKSGTGGGTVSSTPAGINCGVDCSEAYAFNTGVTLTANPAAGSIFAGWSGAGCSGTATCIVTMDATKNVTATFAQAPPTGFALNVAVAGDGAGTVTSSPAGIDCGSTCSADYAAGTVVTLTPIPAALSRFASWTGACTGAGACVITMDAAKSVTATFDVGPIYLPIIKQAP
ncbi:MAG: prealbumin-like fold domain-containing protein, partial [Caldilineaceae bacterium]